MAKIKVGMIEFEGTISECLQFAKEMQKNGTSSAEISVLDIPVRSPPAQAHTPHEHAKRSKKPHWTADERAVIKRLGVTGNVNVAEAKRELPNRSVNAISGFCYRYGFVPTLTKGKVHYYRQNIWTDTELDIVRKYCAPDKAIDWDNLMRELPNRTYNSIKKQKTKLGLGNKYRKRKFAKHNRDQQSGMRTLQQIKSSERMKWICNRTNALMRQSLFMNRERAMSQAAMEWKSQRAVGSVKNGCDAKPHVEQTKAEDVLRKWRPISILHTDSQETLKNLLSWVIQGNAISYELAKTQLVLYDKQDWTQEHFNAFLTHVCFMGKSISEYFGVPNYFRIEKRGDESVLVYAGGTK